MGRGMVERYGQRPGRDEHQLAFIIRASAGGTEPHGFVWEDEMGNGVKVTTEEGAALQSYPPGFVFAGNKGKQCLQIGNAVPPLLAQHVLEHLWKEAA
jgi:DNA (cytosine-5)-methyltransferase 1